MNYKTTRNDFLDFFRGSAIILVIIGHSIQYGVTNFDNVILFRLIYSFHMPLFFVLSGYVSCRFEHKVLPITTKIVGLIRRLLIPYFVWTVCTILIYLAIDYEKYEITDIINLLVGDNRIYWFLICILGCKINAALVDFFCSKKKLLWLKLLLYMLISVAFHAINICNIKYSVYYFIGMTIAYLCKKRNVNEFIFKRKVVYYIISIFLVCLFVRLSLLWVRNGSPAFIDSFNAPTVIKTLIAKIFNLLVALLGSFSFLIINRILHKILCAKIKNIVIVSGRLSMSLYLTSTFLFIVIDKLFASYKSSITYLLLLSVVVSLISTGFIALINRNKYLKFVLFGQ